MGPLSREESVFWAVESLVSLLHNAASEPEERSWQLEKDY